MRFLGVVLLLLAPGLASAQVYKCKDPKTGREIYTQTMPRDYDCTSGKAPAAPAPASDGADPLKKFSEDVGKSREAETQARDQADKARAQKESLCAQWRQRLTALEGAGKVFTVDEQGERHYRSDAENEAQKQEARQGVATECS